jgi:hypothetical protein
VEICKIQELSQEENCIILTMTDEFVHNPQDPVEERFARLEDKCFDISRNMDLLMESLSRNIKLFEEVGGSNSDQIRGEIGRK